MTCRHLAFFSCELHAAFPRLSLVSWIPQQFICKFEPKHHRTVGDQGGGAGGLEIQKPDTSIDGAPGGPQTMQSYIQKYKKKKKGCRGGGCI